MPTLLVLGRSNVFGYGLKDPDRAWPCLLGELLSERTGVEMTVERRRLNLQGDPTAYLEKVFAEVQPDLVTISVSPYDYASLHVQRRLDELVGKRIGSAARWVEKRTMPRDKKRKPNAFHRTIRYAARRFVGTAPQLTRQEVEFTLDRLFRFLAKQEDVAVVIRSSVKPAQVLIDGNRGYERAAQEFAAEWRRKAEERHFRWLEQDPAGAREAFRLGDGIHQAEEGHRIQALDVEDAIFDALCEVQPELRAKDRKQAMEPAART